MTDGRAARWTAAALAAPVVAGAFAATTTWATRVDPLHPDSRTGSAAEPAAPTPAVADDPAIIALRDQLAREQVTLARLSAKVAAVRADAAALAKSNGAVAGGSTSATSARSTGSAGVSRSSGTARSSSAGAAAAAAAPAPTTQGSTGASGTG